MGLPVTRITVGLLVLGVLSWAVFLAGTASLHKLFADVRSYQAPYQAVLPLFCLLQRTADVFLLELDVPRGLLPLPWRLQSSRALPVASMKPDPQHLSRCCDSCALLLHASCPDVQHKAGARMQIQTHMHAHSMVFRVRPMYVASCGGVRDRPGHLHPQPPGLLLVGGVDEFRGARWGHRSHRSRQAAPCVARSGPAGHCSVHHEHVGV